MCIPLIGSQSHDRFAVVARWMLDCAAEERQRSVLVRAYPQSICLTLSGIHVYHVGGRRGQNVMQKERVFDARVGVIVPYPEQDRQFNMDSQ